MWWIWILIVVAILALGFWLLMVRRAANHPAGMGAHAEPRRGQVQGGTHVGGGRSVGPRRDAEVIPDEPEEPTVPVERRGNSPMDL
jgi:hypothetical protein